MTGFDTEIKAFHLHLRMEKDKYCSDKRDVFLNELIS